MTIYLVGFMGCGKTTLAQLLSKKMGMEMIDLDEQIERLEKCCIADIFRSKGEDYFRKLETQVLHETKHRTEGVIATGGGVVERKENQALLKTCCVIYLKWDFETLYERIASDSKRPLATSREALKARFDARRAIYEEVATYQIECEHKTPYSIKQEILTWLKGRERRRG